LVVVRDDLLELVVVEVAGQEAAEVEGMEKVWHEGVRRLWIDTL
jgi:hypothetical protein